MAIKIITLLSINYSIDAAFLNIPVSLDFKIIKNYFDSIEI